MRMHSQAGGLRLGLFAYVVTAVSDERPGESLAHQGGAQILTRCSADGDDPAIAVAVLLLA
jgi:hypothetical protein